MTLATSSKAAFNGYNSGAGNQSTFKVISIPTEESSTKLKNDFAKETISIIDEYLSSYWDMDIDHSIAFDVFFDFLGNKFDHECTVSDTQSVCMDLLKLMANPELEKLGFHRTIEAAEMLQRVFAFCESLKEKKRRAELDRQYVFWYKNIDAVVCLNEDYRKAIKVEEFKRELK